MKSRNFANAFKRGLQKGLSLGAFSIILFSQVLLFCSLAAAAQDFPWELFKSRTIKEVISTTLGAVRPDDSMFLATTELETKAEVTYTGRSKPIDGGRKSFIKSWVGIYKKPEKYADLYIREFLYKEGETEYWIATEEPITKYFDKELNPGDKMTLYLISIGAYRTNKTFDPVLLVEEYQTATPDSEAPRSVRLDKHNTRWDSGR